MTKKTKKQKEKQLLIISEALNRMSQSPSAFDPMGSYTGVNLYNEYAEPVQDADDL